MNELLNLFSNPGAETALFGPLDILLTVVVTTLCMFVISKTYQVTHRGTSYAQTYIHALFLMALCTGIVMMIIGSNIARAFSLVGALSIIRFRTAVKDVRDTAYLFFAIVVGMGCGTGFYLQTVVFTLIVVAFMYGLYVFDYAIKRDTEEILKISFRRDSDAPERIEEYLAANLRSHRLINSIRNFDSDEDTHVYVVHTGKKKSNREVADGLSEIEDVTHSALYVNDQQVGL